MKAKYGIIFLFLICLTGCQQADERHYQGYVEGENIYLSSPNPGILEKLAVHRGQSVSKAQFLFQLDPNPQILMIKELESDLQQARNVLQDLKNPRRDPEINAIKAQIAQSDAQLHLSQLRVDRYQILYAKQAASKDALDEVIAIYEQQKKLKAQYEANLQLANLGSRQEQINAQQAQIDSMVAKLAEAKWQLQQKRAAAPFNGLIYDTYYRIGEYVGAQQAVLALLTPENVYIEFFVPEIELASLNLGKKIAFTCDGCGEEGTAIISYISPEAEFMPPLVYSRENNEKLVFRIQANHIPFNRYKPGQPITVLIR